ncbi:MAG: sodium:proton antiporter [Aeromicrobium sp.]|jgi:hypothetical protein|nr:sodium:proton antiporter [Aeromicrobium sp.]
MGSTGKSESGRGAPSERRLDRNWQELLQELRVAQTGVQILTGFLLTIPFTPRFEELGSTRHAVYGAVLCCAVAATLLLMTPVALHRALFHRGARPWLVETADRLARWGLGAQTVAIVGVVWFILELIGPWWIAAAVVSTIATFVLVVWVAVPARERRIG